MLDRRRRRVFPCFVSRRFGPDSPPLGASTPAVWSPRGRRGDPPEDHGGRGGRQGRSPAVRTGANGRRPKVRPPMAAEPARHPTSTVQRSNESPHCPLASATPTRRPIRRRGGAAPNPRDVHLRAGAREPAALQGGGHGRSPKAARRSRDRHRRPRQRSRLGGASPRKPLHAVPPTRRGVHPPRTARLRPRGPSAGHAPPRAQGADPDVPRRGPVRRPDAHAKPGAPPQPVRSMSSLVPGRPAK